MDDNKEDRFILLDYKRVNGFHQFSIRDNGIGIQETSKNIFDPFTYINSKEDYNGTGIGLAMVKKIIEKQNGNIWFESDLKVGTTYYFTIKSN